MPWLSLVVAFGASLLLVPVVRWLSFRTGRIAYPRKDRWNTRPTPTLGGVGMFGAFVLAVVWRGGVQGDTLPILAGASIMFLLGLYDDYRELSPPAKLVGQILAAAVVVFFGYQIAFFKFDLLNILLTFLWLVGITNALNLLDNMDGLAGGIALIVALFLGYFFLRVGNQPAFVDVAAALAGAILGFLVFNFPPASIFMGDSGSLFLGFTLASLAVARKTSASNVLAVIAIPALLFLLPILDTTLVTITRLMRGQSPAQGGRDHTSHRLIAFGLTERQAVLALYAVALLSGIASTVVERRAYDFSLVFVPVLIIALTLLAAYLAQLKVVPDRPPEGQYRTLARVAVQLAYRQRLFEIVLDFLLISVAYYLAWWTRYTWALSEVQLALYLRTLPMALFVTYLSFGLFGVYRGVWEYIGVQDAVGYVRAVTGAAVMVAVGLYLLPVSQEKGILPLAFLFGVFLFVGLAASRSSFRVLDQVYTRQTRRADEPVLVYGAGRAGEMAVRWMQMNPGLGYRPVAFLDDDARKWGRLIHGVRVAGDAGQLEEIVQREQPAGVLFTVDEALQTPAGQ
ncbi:MAG: hypothetical protein D6755_10170, partial [Anaerolineae bacterium]